MQIRVNQYWLSAAGSKADCAVRTPHLTSYLESERNVIHVCKLWSVVVDPGLIIARATQMLCGKSCSSQKKSCGASEHIVPSAGVSLCNCQSSLGGPSSPASSYPQTVLLHSTPNHPHSLPTKGTAQFERYGVCPHFPSCQAHCHPAPPSLACLPCCSSSCPPLTTQSSQQPARAICC